ncbi:MAG TPA: bifunctional DNA-formamidopyrimidine glycosylase/DNA-(apurinic or apyrimidinic site) lyase [Polyangia bacterium]|jgi:formamidopyrimidine-DNA glycosylase|nr:bifunctional DNA-formamidopyrimidine glycosylase/DNA-(apurinic or apyrimidinic site) lyase [Polyangia bacterium]
MPELPEVETIVRGLAPVLTGRRMAGVWGSGLPLRLARPVPIKVLQALCTRRRIARVRRLGKYILLDLDAAGGAGVAIHLGMSGRLRTQPAAVPRAAHTHVVWKLEGGDELRFVDPRRFGWVGTATPIDNLPELAALGPDPLTNLDQEGLAALLRGVRAPIKSFLLDQSRIAGLGNIYVCEALHRAGIHPTTPAGRLRRHVAQLLTAIRDSLESAIANRGTSLRDYVDANGLPGDNSATLLVYGREGEPCARCGAVIKRRVDAARSTFFCPRCQRRG